ncbi:uncharacterized protein N7477_010010 [Penicillium maclennaniae]|uniref:uncharacterized protein n=1 Tax=Penicillium maclennaniae TaxID=1343394 RepID=UPI00253FC708|nr:uncharacterized protein N7477_010010 [Penicillium maclennaniae]KAJ5662394.1 hypothetical protein N7477_010010 [Penicillium maclennaniae]
MSSQRYQRVNAQDEEDGPHSYQLNPARSDLNPTSPPPSFRSRSSSPSSRRLLHDDPLRHDDQELADAFGDEDGSDDDGEPDDRQRLMRANTDGWAPPDHTQTPMSSSSESRNDAQEPTRAAPGIVRRQTMLPTFATPDQGPERGEKNEDLPPSYEEAAADATPPYWETTIVAPGIGSDEVYVDGLPVGSIFSFVWNAMISMSFQLVGFLLTYLLHTTHAAKNGSRAGLGLTLVQYGFYMKGGSEIGENGGSDGGAMSTISTSEWISYVLMIVGWFILIRAVSDFLRARRHEQLVLQSPDRGLGVPVIAEGERSETVV